jgi:hypothetical protein
MVWLIITAVILGVIFRAHAYAVVSEKSGNEDRPFSLPTIFLADRPSSHPMMPFKTASFLEPRDDLTGDGVKKPLLVSDESFSEKFGTPRAGSKIMTKVLLPRGGVEPSGYGLYSYLLFGSSSEAGRSKRYAASRAYCKNFPELSEALGVFKPIDVNVFSVPTNDRAPRDTYCKDAEKLVDDYYDYTLAKRLLQDVGLEGDGIYLVACERPILGGSCDPKKTLVVDLTTVKESLSELCVLEFRRQTRKKETWNDTSLRKLVFELRKKLPDIAEFISIAKAAAKDR